MIQHEYPIVANPSELQGVGDCKVSVIAILYCSDVSNRTPHNISTRIMLVADNAFQTYNPKILKISSTGLKITFTMDRIAEKVVKIMENEMNVTVDAQYPEIMYCSLSGWSLPCFCIIVSLSEMREIKLFWSKFNRN